MSKIMPWWVCKHEQLVLLEFLHDYWKKNQTTPTAKKIATTLNWTCPQVYSRIGALRAKGALPKWWGQNPESIIERKETLVHKF